MKCHFFLLFEKICKMTGYLSIMVIYMQPKIMTIQEWSYFFHTLIFSKTHNPMTFCISFFTDIYVKFWFNRKYIQVYNWHTQGNDKHSRPTPTFDQKGNAKTKRRISLRIISYYSKRALTKQHRVNSKAFIFWSTKIILFRPRVI